MVNSTEGVFVGIIVPACGDGLVTLGHLPQTRLDWAKYLNAKKNARMLESWEKLFVPFAKINMKMLNHVPRDEYGAA